MNWTTPDNLRAQVEKLWDRGQILSALLTGEVLFPKRLVLKGPSSSDLLDHFEAARTWARTLLGTPYLRFEMREARHRVLGMNAMPSEAWVQTLDQAVAMLRKQREVHTYLDLANMTEGRNPAMLQWLIQRPLKALDLAEVWPLLLDVVAWVEAHPRPGVYLRQVDVPGVHTKFIESHRGVLGELLDLVLPPESIDSMATSVSQFSRRYGFQDQPETIRFRILDPACPMLPGLGTPDVTLDALSFSRMGKIAGRVFITENKTNFLAFPFVKDSIVVFGAGYGLQPLGSAVWLQKCQVHYWGDIDTHGFAILDELRTHFRHVVSFLMDRDTLMASRDLWGTEDTPTNRDLQHLTPSEAELYADLRDNRIRSGLRLEQERIGFHRVVEAVNHLCNEGQI